MRIMSLIYILNFIIGMSVGRWKKQGQVPSAVSSFHWWSSNLFQWISGDNCIHNSILIFITYGLKCNNIGRCYYISIYMTIKNKSQWELLTVRQQQNWKSFLFYFYFNQKQRFKHFASACTWFLRKYRWRTVLKFFLPFVFLVLLIFSLK